MTRYEVFQACHQPDETYSSWLTTRLSEWASLSGFDETWKPLFKLSLIHL